MASIKADSEKDRTTGDGRGGDNIVTWRLSENALQKEIIETFSIAVLLTRPDADAPLKVLFDVTAEIDSWRQQIKDTADETFHGKTERFVKLYDPGNKQDKDRFRAPDGVDAGALAKLEPGIELYKLTYVHESELLKAKQIYSIA
jgi:hypothetical protein